MNTLSKQPPALYKIVVGHYLVSAICFLLLSVMLLFSAEELLGHYFNPKLLAITHLAALGWGTFIIFGACYQLIPVVFETNLYSYRLPWMSFVFFIAGLALLVYSFWIFDPGVLMQTGSLMLLIAIAVFTFIVVKTSLKVKNRGKVQQEFIVTSSFWLLATAVLGVLLVFNFRFPFLPKDHLHFLRLHAHMGIAGWFLLLIIGVSAKLLPMFLVSRVQREALLSWSFYLINTGLILFLIDAYISGINWKTTAIAFVVFTGIVLYLFYVYFCFRSRLKSQFDLPIISTLISFFLMITALAVLPFLIKFSGSGLGVRLSSLYGSLLFTGWLSALIIGQTFKTLPFIVWVKKYEHLAGKVKTPLPADLYSRSLLRYQTVFFILFSVCFYSAMIGAPIQLMYLGLGALVLTSALYLLNVIAVLFHRTKNFNHA